jgi:hypothetical protein
MVWVLMVVVLALTAVLLALNVCLELNDAVLDRGPSESSRFPARAET